MTRRTQEMSPTILKSKLDAGFSKFGQVFAPDEAVAPILAPIVQASLHQWLIEQAAGDDLAKMGLKPRRTMALFGPPGCGKTTLAHHLAARLGLHMVVIKMAALTSQYVGETGRNVHQLTSTCHDHQQDMILFLDEFDAIAAKRLDQQSSAGREMNNITVAMLQMIDDFKGVLLAATNRSDNIDPAIWRRFAMRVEILEPGGDERYAILARYLEPLTPEEALLDRLTDLSDGASPALLRDLAEGIKRELVLAPRLGFRFDAAETINRVTQICRPHESMKTPPLWQYTITPADLPGMAWPPATRPMPEGAA